MPPFSALSLSLSLDLRCVVVSNEYLPDGRRSFLSRYVPPWQYELASFPWRYVMPSQCIGRCIHTSTKPMVRPNPRQNQKGPRHVGNGTWAPRGSVADWSMEKLRNRVHVSPTLVVPPHPFKDPATTIPRRKRTSLRMNAETHGVREGRHL